ncbi:hypothetical protein DBT_0147 [Dissulfuribacter thermophilus]|uniref:Uncharacterized protein n=1 Tax=Dissulfuribacter thermophilus TaxID=1156395 RepID=A0A1B9F8U1_9BACT|nr:hypothetical protein DBT_0147 [Dissulfuribacter thermophilus]
MLFVEASPLSNKCYIFIHGRIDFSSSLKFTVKIPIGIIRLVHNAITGRRQKVEASPAWTKARG